MVLFKSIINYFGNLFRNRIPGQVVIQITNRCNATCPQCGMRRTAEMLRSALPEKTIRQIIDSCAEKGVQAVSFTGGEPLLMLDNLINWIDHAGKAGIPFIRTGTNGFLFCGADKPDFSDRVKRLADRLADTSLRNFWISLDSYIPQVHERMRGLKGVVAGIEKALPIFHSAGLYPSANLGINRLVGGELTSKIKAEDFNHRVDYLKEFYDRYVFALDNFYRFVSNLGFTIVNTCYPMSISNREQLSGLKAVYAASAIEDVVRFSEDEKSTLYQALLDTIPLHRHRLRIFSPLSSIYMLQQHYANGHHTSTAFGCRGGVDFFFIDAIKGDTFPCGYRGNENLGKFSNLNLKAIHPAKDCFRCDWECFRDPSEMFAPFLQILHEPVKLINKMIRDPKYYCLLINDLRYYRQCKLFSGRQPMNLQGFIFDRK